ncbi:MAG TPA: hypothetical protein VNC78_10190 [Actinomycetota bacterium]|nr:hypothetical protein [Actinomycetota bacterium]
MSKLEKLLKAWLLSTGLVYAAGALDFVVRPRAATASLNLAGGEPLEAESPGLYNSLAGAYMATIAALALTAAGDPATRRNLLPPLMVGKAASSGALFYRYVRTQKRGFAAAAALDAAILGITAGLYQALDD